MGRQLDARACSLPTLTTSLPLMCLPVRGQQKSLNELQLYKQQGCTSMQKRRLNPPPTPLGTREPSAPTTTREVEGDVAACVSWYLGQQEQSGKHFNPLKNRHKAHLQRTGIDFWPYNASNGPQVTISVSQFRHADGDAAFELRATGERITP